MSKKFGFIGCGNMGGALALAVSRSDVDKEIILSNRTTEKAEKLAKEIGAVAANNREVFDSCDYIFLGVKPQMMKDVLSDAAPVLKKRPHGSFVLITMAAALTIDDIRNMAGVSCPVLRIMPNTPVSVGEGVVMYAYDEKISKASVDEIVRALEPAGECVPLPESLIDAGSAVAGCGPAFAQMFIEALADGGVACGLPRATAVRLASQMLLGSAKLTLTSGKNPGVLKDEVCSPGGTTIEGVRALEEHRFRAAAMAGVTAAYEKTLKLKK